MLIGTSCSQQIGDGHSLVDLAGVLVGQDVDAVERTAEKVNRPRGVFQRHPAGGRESAAIYDQFAAVHRDSAGTVGGELIAAVGKIRLNRNIVAVNCKRALAAHRDRGGLIPLIDGALARDRERAVQHLNDIGRITVRKTDISLRQQVPIQVQRNAAVASKLDFTREARESFILILRQIHII